MNMRSIFHCVQKVYNAGNIVWGLGHLRPEDELSQNPQLPDNVSEGVNSGNTQQHGMSGYNRENTSDKKCKLDHVANISDSGCACYTHFLEHRPVWIGLHFLDFIPPP